MSTDLTLKTEKINEKRKKLADEMVTLFGLYTFDADRYVFEPTFSEMASILVLDGSLISRLLAPPNLKRLTKNTTSEKSYNTILKIVKALNQQKIALEEKHQAEITTLQQKLEEYTLKRTEVTNPKRISIWKISAASLFPILLIVFYYTSRGNTNLVNDTPPLANTEDLTENTSPYPHLPLETILNPSFEEDGKNSAAAHWYHNGLGGPIQPSYTQTSEGKTSAKLPKTGDRIGYQLIRVLKNTDYVLNFNYLMRGPGTPSGSLTMYILDENVKRPADINPAIIATTTINFEQKYKNKYREESLIFNSGIHDKVAIYFNNKDIQCKVDNFNLERGQ